MIIWKRLVLSKFMTELLLGPDDDNMVAKITDLEERLRIRPQGSKQIFSL